MKLPPSVTLTVPVPAESLTEPPIQTSPVPVDSRTESAPLIVTVAEPPGSSPRVTATWPPPVIVMRPPSWMSRNPTAVSLAVLLLFPAKSPDAVSVEPSPRMVATPEPDEARPRLSWPPRVTSAPLSTSSVPLPPKDWPVKTAPTFMAPPTSAEASGPSRTSVFVKPVPARRPISMLPSTTSEPRPTVLPAASWPTRITARPKSPMIMLSSTSSVEKAPLVPPLTVMMPSPVSSVPTTRSPLLPLLTVRTRPPAVMSSVPTPARPTSSRRRRHSEPAPSTTAVPLEPTSKATKPSAEVPMSALRSPPLVMLRKPVPPNPTK